MKLLITIVCTATSSLAFVAEVRSQQFEKERAEIISEDQYKQPKALGRLAKAGKPAIPTLLQIIALKDFPKKDYGSKMRVVGTLQTILHEPANRSKSTLDELGRMLESGVANVADGALSCIAEFKGDPEARKILTSFVTGHAHPKLRGAAIGTLVIFTDHDKSLIPLLRESLRDPSDFLKMRAAGALGVLGNKDGLASCQEILRRKPGDSASNFSIKQAAEAAEHIGDPSALPLLKKVAEGEEYSVARDAAYMAIGKIELSLISDDAGKLRYIRNSLKNEAYARWGLFQLRQLIKDDSAHARELFSIMRDPLMHEGVRNEAKTFLWNYGWITQVDYWKKPQDMVLQSKPLFNFDEKMRAQERMAIDSAEGQ